MAPLLRILALWRVHLGWLLLGFVTTLAALVAGVGMMTLSGAALATAVTGALLAPMLLRGFGAARVILRYFERLWTHEATFRALASLRVWFFRGLSRSSAGGLGFRRAGDVLARLVSDVEALDGLYVAILLPLACAVLLLPALVVLIGLRDPVLAAVIGVLFAAAAFGLPWIAMRVTRGAGQRLAATSAALRIAALDALTGLREVRAFGAEGRMLAAVQAREGALLSAQREVSARMALAGAAAFLCGQLAILAVLIAAGFDPVAAVAAAFLVLAVVRGGGRPAARRRAGGARGRSPPAACWRRPRRRPPCPTPPGPRRCPPAPRCASRRCISAGATTGPRCSPALPSTCRRAAGWRSSGRRARASPRSPRWR